MRCARLAVLVLLVSLAVAPAAAPAQSVAVPNPSFEAGRDAPDGWTLSGGKGDWLSDGAADGKRAIAVTGTGADSNMNFWRSGPLAIEPGAVYRLSFRARSLGGSGGTLVSGPVFCNRDLGAVAGDWTEFASVFVAPSNLKADDAWLRFGQWEVKGGVAFDAVGLARAMPVYAGLGDLGEGERIDGTRYIFAAPLGGVSRNHSRALVRYTGTFNTDRWCIADGQEVVYRHALTGRRQTAADVTAAVTWYGAGELVVEASADGKAWRPLGTIGKVGGGSYAVPKEMLPAGEVWVRLSGRPGGAKPGAGASLQVGSYGYQATLDGPATSLKGETRFLAVTRADPRLKVEIDSLGDGLPGGDNRIVGRVTNTTDQPIDVRPTITVAGQASPVPEAVSLQPGENPFEVTYTVPGPGTHTLTGSVVLEAAPDQGFAVKTSLFVADLYETGFGERLPSEGGRADLWWASSGWKVSRIRPVPEKQGRAVRIRAARHEAEAAQLVVRPATPLKGFTARAEGLVGPGGASIPAACVEVLRVRYVPIAQPTDGLGTVGDWPDPLPPLAAPVDLEADRNQPLWVRVTVPQDAKPGVYAGRIRLAAEDYAADVTLEVEVYDFALPERMTCQTAFGFDPGNVWRYQKLEKPEDRRAVLEKYLADFSAHHISPYDPAPLDGFRVTWPKDAAGKYTLVPAFDWTAWDAAMTRAIDRWHFNAFMMPVVGMGGGSFHARFEPELLGFKEGAPEYKTAFTNYLGAIEAHLKDKGWLDEAFVYWFDEPDPKDYAFVMNGFRKLKEAAPGLVRMLTEQVEPGLVGGPNLWCPLTPEYNHARAEERRRAGERFWWYLCCGPRAPYATIFIDHPSTDLRVWLWQTWQRKIEGILVWQTNYWTSPTAYTDPACPQNPYDDPASWVDGYGVARGTRQLWGNGDGRFIYPPEAAADAKPAAPVLDGPVDSIRWEMLRDGVEDYEYLVTLRRMLAEKGAKVPEADRARYAALLEVPAEISKDMTTFTKDPGPIERRRDAVAKAIETLGRL